MNIININIYIEGETLFFQFNPSLSLSFALFLSLSQKKTQNTHTHQLLYINLHSSTQKSIFSLLLVSFRLTHIIIMKSSKFQYTYVEIDETRIQIYKKKRV